MEENQQIEFPPFAIPSLPISLINPYEEGTPAFIAHEASNSRIIQLYRQKLLSISQERFNISATALPINGQNDINMMNNPGNSGTFGNSNTLGNPGIWGSLGISDSSDKLDLYAEIPTNDRKRHAHISPSGEAAKRRRESEKAAMVQSYREIREAESQKALEELTKAEQERTSGNSEIEEVYEILEGTDAKKEEILKKAEQDIETYEQSLDEDGVVINNDNNGLNNANDNNRNNVDYVDIDILGDDDESNFNDEVDVTIALNAAHGTDVTLEVDATELKSVFKRTSYGEVKDTNSSFSLFGLDDVDGTEKSNKKQATETTLNAASLESVPSTSQSSNVANSTPDPDVVGSPSTGSENSGGVRTFFAHCLHAVTNVFTGRTEVRNATNYSDHEPCRCVIDDNATNMHIIETGVDISVGFRANFSFMSPSVNAFTLNLAGVELRTENVDNLPEVVRDGALTAIGINVSTLNNPDFMTTNTVDLIDPDNDAITLSALLDGEMRDLRIQYAGSQAVGRPILHVNEGVLLIVWPIFGYK